MGRFTLELISARHIGVDQLPPTQFPGHNVMHSWKSLDPPLMRLHGGLKKKGAHVVCAGGCLIALHPDAIAETYWQLHQHHRSGWTHELDLPTYKETF